MIQRLLHTPAFAACLALTLGFGVFPAVAMAGPAGLYRSNQMEVAGELNLREDGSFTYALSAGALDELSQGRWKAEGNTVTLTTDPLPKPAQFSTGPSLIAKEGDEEPLPYLYVSLPGGRGLAGIDFTITCRDGGRIDAYTQSNGWSPDGAVCDTPQWIELSEPIHGIFSERFSIAPGATALHFVLIPNDIGIIDLTGATAVIEGDRLTLSRNPGVISFRREKR
jgi:hypothetical protein